MAMRKTASVAPSTRLISAGDLRSFGSALLRAWGFSDEEAARTARIQVEADLRGVQTHGIRMLELYRDRINEGQINPTPKYKVLREGPAYLHLDADKGLGHAVSHLAMQQAVEKAARIGVGIAAVRNSNHYGAAAHYALMAAEADMIGFTTSNRRGHGNLAAFGASEAVLGNNPLAYAIPAGRERPIVLDMACGAVAFQKIVVARTRGEKIPLDWGLTKAGEPTDDPNEAVFVLPVGGAKGSGLAVVTGCIASILTSAGHLDAKRTGLFFLCLDVATFADLATFKSEVDERIQGVRNSRRAKGVERIYYPGEPEWIRREERIRGGIPMPEENLQTLEALGREVGVGPTWAS